MIIYYPKNRIKTDQYTAGGELTLNGQEYKGPYYTTFDGQVFTGKNPYSIGANHALVPAFTDDVTKLTFSEQSVSSENRSTIAERRLDYLIPYYPKPTPADYSKGSIVRYFAKRVTGDLSIIEISKEQFDYMQSKKTEVDDYRYQVENVFWKITGPLHDDRTSKQYPIAGIVDTNKRLVETKDKTFPGLKAYIGENYTKFAVPS